VSGRNYEEAEQQAVLDRLTVAAVIQQTDSAALHEKLKTILAGMPADQMDSRIKQFSSPAFRQMLTDDPRPEFRGLSSPVLALFGENDLNSPPQSIAAMRETLKSAGNARSEVRLIPGVNFMMQSSDTGLGREGNWAEETISPLVLDQITAWMK
jgi:pimeloyl-ACP methyl ester carboxylesterase